MESTKVATSLVALGYRGQNVLETVGGLPNITADGFDSLEQLF
jgi:hypothetical protein